MTFEHELSIVRLPAFDKSTGIWLWASNNQGLAFDIAMACCGDLSTWKGSPPSPYCASTCPAEIMVFNVIDLMKPRPQTSLGTS